MIALQKDLLIVLRSHIEDAIDSDEIGVTLNAFKPIIGDMLVNPNIEIDCSGSLEKLTELDIICEYCSESILPAIKTVIIDQIDIVLSAND